MMGYRAFAVRVAEGEAFLVPANHADQRELTVPLEYPSMRAQCRRTGAAHRAPDADCHCGYHAYDGVGGASDYLQRGAAWVMAEVWGYGKLEVHDFGWRAERLQIVRFFTPLCDHAGLDVCFEPATLFWTLGRDWPSVTRFGCAGHAETRGENGRWNRQQQRFDDMPAIAHEALPVTPVDVALKMLAGKFEAGVADVAATMRVFLQNPQWKQDMYHRQLERAERERAEAEALYEANRRQREIDARFHEVRMAREDAKWQAQKAQKGMGI